MRPEEPSYAMKVDVRLPSGDGYSIEVSPETLSELKAASAAFPAPLEAHCDWQRARFDDAE